MGKKRYKINYAEGDCFAVPLVDGGFARGVVARMDGKGEILGYFFGPKYKEIPRKCNTSDLHKDSAIMVAFFSHLGFVENRWHVCGRIELWIRDDWPIPVFGRVEMLLKKWGHLCYYHFGPCSEIPAQKKVAVEEAMQYPEDGLAGSVSVERCLAKLLCDGNVPPPIKIVPVPKEYE